MVNHGYPWLTMDINSCPWISMVFSILGTFLLENGLDETSCGKLVVLANNGLEKKNITSFPNIGFQKAGF